MCIFPNIRYDRNYIPLQRNNDTLPGSPRGMFSNLVNRHIVDGNFLDGIHNMEELESTIFDLIDHYPENGASLEKIFHLIQIWGGRTGRGIYNNQVFHWNEIEPLYRAFIDIFRQFRQVNDETISRAYEAVGGFYKALHKAGYKGMAVAFITKHARFWMHRNLPDSMLPIYDSTFSDNVMQRGKNARLRDLPDYWRVMKRKADKENVPMTSLERQLFNYYRSDTHRQ